MENRTIDYRDIKIISPYEILSLHKLEIVACTNEHVKLSYTAVISEDKKDEYVTGSKHTDKIEIRQVQDGNFIRTLFIGQLYDIAVNARNNKYYLTVEAISYTYDMDIERKRRSYQTPYMAYDAMTQSVVNSYNSSDFFPMIGKGEPINIFTLQYDETDWEFLKRMASRFGSVLVPEGRHSSPKFWFGLPEGDNFDLEKTSYTITKALKPYRDSKENHKINVNESSFTIYEIETPIYMYLGDNVTINHVKTKVSRAIMIMENGVLQFRYTLMPKEGIRQELIRNPRITGLSLEGTVIG
ncbi:MAG: hypothetical protein FWE02_04955, partial [Defluviitaleaceae bacterium]|nr:hypothetical protein [Defluviitaleaceae bacterium]